MTGWATLARERADRLDDEISDLRDEGIAAAKLDRLHHELDEVREHHLGQPSRLAWLTGDPINESWSVLHRIEERIDELVPETRTEVLVREAGRHLGQEKHDKRTTELRLQLKSATAPEQKKRVSVETIKEMHAAAEERHESERNQQRGILYIAAGLFVAALILIIVQAALPAGDRIIPSPSGTAVGSLALLILVMLFGMLGGALSALVSLYMTSKKLTNTLWFDPRPSLTLVKVVLGLWTAVVGVLAVGTGVVTGIYQSLAAVLLLALIFGYAQQAVTGFIDRKVASIVDATSS
jgi:hypothetical protein